MPRRRRPAAARRLPLPTPPAPSPPAAASRPLPRPTTASFATAALGSGAALNGSLPFPADNAWNTDISGAASIPNSDALIAGIGLTTGLHPDFGAGLPGGAPIGIPYIVVAGTQAKVAIVFTAYGNESDAGPIRCRPTRRSKAARTPRTPAIATCS